MILIEQSVGATRLPPSSALAHSSEGSTTLIILERDGSISHSSSAIEGEGRQRRAHVALAGDLSSGHPEPSVIERIMGFAFDVLGISNLEVQVYEPQKR
ncbi:MAG: hypothetical protein HGA19_06760 [Oscillochloris sp.]|nr:hypothetical protein [Oscillochloris sp.]